MLAHNHSPGYRRQVGVIYFILTLSHSPFIPRPSLHPHPQPVENIPALFPLAAHPHAVIRYVTD